MDKRDQLWTNGVSKGDPVYDLSTGDRVCPQVTDPIRPQVINPVCPWVIPFFYR